MKIKTNHNLLENDLYNVCGFIDDICIGEARLSKTYSFSIHIDSAHRGLGYSKQLFQSILNYIDTLNESVIMTADPEIPTWFLDRFGFSNGVRARTYGEVCLRNRNNKDFIVSEDVAYFMFLLRSPKNTQEQLERIKRKINRIKNDLYYEELKTNAILVTNLGLGDHINTTGMARHFSTLYDSLTLVCLQKNLANLKQFYYDDPTIKFYCIEKISDIDTTQGCSKEKFQAAVGRYDAVFISKLMGYDTFPYCLYTSVGLEDSMFWTHYYIPENSESFAVYKMLLEDLKQLKLTTYIAITNNYVNGRLCDINRIKRHLINKEALVINLDGDLAYETDHPYYEIAKKYNKLPIYKMKYILENANELILADSSIFCLAIHIDIKTNLFYYIPRGNEYVYLFSKKCVEKGVSPRFLGIA